MGVVVLLAVFRLLQPIPHRREHRTRQHPMPPSHTHDPLPTTSFCWLSSVTCLQPVNLLALPRQTNGQASQACTCFLDF